MQFYKEFYIEDAIDKRMDWVMDFGDINEICPTRCIYLGN